MGKKRTNATKKKQAAKKNKLSSAFGVSVLKGGTISRNNGRLDPAAVDGNAHAKKLGGGPSLNKDMTAKTAPATGNDNTMQMDAPGKRPRGSNGENDEFRRQHASLEERSLALQARKDEQRRVKKGMRKHQQQKGWGKFARPSTNFAPATLTLAPKTTQQLVDDAANQLVQGMDEIGQRVASVAPGQSTLAAAAGLNWQMRVSDANAEAAQADTQARNNPFAALDDDSDSDNEWSDMKPKKTVQQFQFQPASFSFQPASFSIPQAPVEPAVNSFTSHAPVGADDDEDPDL